MFACCIDWSCDFCKLRSVNVHVGSLDLTCLVLAYLGLAWSGLDWFGFVGSSVLRLVVGFPRFVC